MSRLIAPGPEFDALFTDFHRCAWRFEAQPTYHVDAEQDPMRRYLDTGEVDVSYLSGWLDGVREASRNGKLYARVRVLTEPLTDYLRFEMAVAPHNVAAGEEIHTLPQARARELALPDYDFWLFDDQWLAIMHFTPLGLQHAEIVSEREVVDQHRAWRDLTLAHADRFQSYHALVEG